MQTAPRYLSPAELEETIRDVLASPRDVGRLEAIFVRPAENRRQALDTATLSPERGIDGDRWFEDPYLRLENGRPDPRNQVSLMNGRFLRQIAIDEEAMCLAGDNLIVDLDLSEENLPAGSQLAVGHAVVLEVSNVPHTGCGKLSRRYGAEAKAFINNPRGKALHLRGRYAKIVTGGAIAVGDSVRKLSAVHGDSA